LVTPAPTTPVATPLRCPIAVTVTVSSSARVSVAPSSPIAATLATVATALATVAAAVTAEGRVLWEGLGPASCHPQMWWDILVGRHYKILPAEVNEFDVSFLWGFNWYCFNKSRLERVVWLVCINSKGCLG